MCHWPLSYGSFVAGDVTAAVVDIELPMDSVKDEV